MEGDAGTWKWTDGGKVRNTDNPLLLANRKAKKLKSLLVTQPALKKLRVPYIEAIVFLSNRGVKCRLQGRARQGVYLREDTEQEGNPPIGRVLTGLRLSLMSGEPLSTRLRKGVPNDNQ